MSIDSKSLFPQKHKVRRQAQGLPVFPKGAEGVLTGIPHSLLYLSLLVFTAFGPQDRPSVVINFRLPNSSLQIPCPLLGTSARDSETLCWGCEM